jgi:hypothetical protein
MPGEIFQDENGFVLEDSSGGVYDDTCPDSVPCCGDLYVKMKLCGLADEDAEPMWVPSLAVSYSAINVSGFEQSGEDFEIEGGDCFCIVSPLERKTRGEIPFGDRVATFYSGGDRYRAGCCECLFEKRVTQPVFGADVVCEYQYETIEGDPPGLRRNECCCKRSDSSGLSVSGSMTYTFTSTSERDGSNYTIVLEHTLSSGTATYTNTTTDYLGNVTVNTVTVEYGDLVGVGKCGVSIQETQVGVEVASLLNGPGPGLLFPPYPRPTVTCTGGTWTISYSNTESFVEDGGYNTTTTATMSATWTWELQQPPGECGCDPEEPGDAIMASPLDFLPE